MPLPRHDRNAARFGVHSCQLKIVLAGHRRIYAGILRGIFAAGAMRRHRYDSALDVLPAQSQLAHENKHQQAPRRAIPDLASCEEDVMVSFRSPKKELSRL